MLNTSRYTDTEKDGIWDCFIYWDYFHKYFQRNAWIFLEIKCPEFSSSFCKDFFFLYYFNLPMLPSESNFPNCSSYPPFIETSPLLFKSNFWTLRKNKLTVIDLWSSARAFQQEKSTEIASSFENCHICFSSNLIKTQVLSPLSLKSSLS